jgi:hypothetical protein
MMRPSSEEIERYLRTGEADPLLDSNLLRHALFEEVARRTSVTPIAAMPEGLDAVDLARRKLGPMVQGLFSRAEQRPVLELLERSIAFLTSERIGEVVLGSVFPSTAWDLANLYLSSVGAELLGEGAPRIVGLSEEVTCYVSMEYFGMDDPFSDFVVHEAAHVFHNCKRRTAGLPENRRREWLLDIEFKKREVFAYSCEAYASILERSKTPRERIALAEEYADLSPSFDDRADPGEVADIVRNACVARAGWRAGWRVILRRCSPAKLRRSPTRPGE